MIKLLTIVSVSFFLISCHTNNEEKKDAITDSVNLVLASDSTKLTSNSIADSSSAINIKEYQLSTEEANEMIKWYKGCSPSMRHDKTTITVMDNVEDHIRKANPRAEITWINARFKDKDDENLYGRTAGYAAFPEKCAVKNYITKLLKVKGDTITYYLVVHLCPPPPNSCDTTHVNRNIIYPPKDTLNKNQN